MTNLSDVAPLLAHGGQLYSATVLRIEEHGMVEVQLLASADSVFCQVLHTGSLGPSLSEGDAVLVWLGYTSGVAGVVLGRVGAYVDVPQSVVPPAEFATRPKTLVIEAQGDLVLRNSQARIKLGADGDVEISCSSFTTRSQRLLRLLAPFIKLN